MWIELRLPVNQLFNRQIFFGFSYGSADEESACKAEDPRDAGSIPGPGRSPGEGNGNPLQYSYLENPMDRGAWRATVYSVAKSLHIQLKQLSIYAPNHSIKSKNI